MCNRKISRINQIRSSDLSQHRIESGYHGGERWPKGAEGRTTSTVRTQPEKVERPSSKGRSSEKDESHCRRWKQEDQDETGRWRIINHQDYHGPNMRISMFLDRKETIWVFGMIVSNSTRTPLIDIMGFRVFFFRIPEVVEEISQIPLNNTFVWTKVFWRNL